VYYIHNISSVQRRTADIESLIATIQKKDTGINQYMIMHSTKLLKEAVITKLSVGNSVDVFGLGTFYLIAFPQKDDESKTKIPVNFTLPKEARDAVAGAGISVMQTENTDPVIAGLKNLYTQKAGTALSFFCLQSSLQERTASLLKHSVRSGVYADIVTVV
jgi:hypothetical protein